MQFSIRTYLSKDDCGSLYAAIDYEEFAQVLLRCFCAVAFSVIARGMLLGPRC